MTSLLLLLTHECTAPASFAQQTSTPGLRAPTYRHVGLVSTCAHICVHTCARRVSALAVPVGIPLTGRTGPTGLNQEGNSSSRKSRKQPGKVPREGHQDSGSAFCGALAFASVFCLTARLAPLMVTQGLHQLQPSQPNTRTRGSTDSPLPVG